MCHSHKRSRSPDGRSPASRTRPSSSSAPKRARVDVPKKQAKYTFGDCFCGAGGASQGAKDAGLAVLWGVDKEAAACKTWMANFPRADCYRYAIKEFLDRAGALELYVDILHLSPPCQFWSPAHTNEGKDDEANEAALYTVGKIIETVRPRIVTLEQTLGLFTHHPTAFYQLVQIIKSAGYNVSYLAADFAEYGLVQARNRLVIIAAKTGIPIPAFPAPTHGPYGSGLKHWTTVSEALNAYTFNPRREPLHNPHNMKPRNGIEYDPHTHQLPGCITTSASANIHHSGKRSYSLRENACFQTFPPHYIFCEPGIAKQIGNALPPAIWAQVLGNCAKALEDFDNGIDRGNFSPYSPSVGMKRVRTPNVNTNSPVIDLDAEDIDDSPIPIKAPLRPKSRPSSEASRHSAIATLSPGSERSVTLAPGPKEERKASAVPSDWSALYGYGSEEGAKKSVTDPRGRRMGKEVIVLD